MKNISIRSISMICLLLVASCGGKSKDKAADAPMAAADPMTAPAMTPEMAPEKAPEKAPEMAPEMAPEKAPEMAPEPAAGGGIPQEKLPAVESIVFPKPKMYKSIELDRLQAKAVYLKLHAAVALAAKDGTKLELKPLLESVSVLPKGACTFGMRAALLDPVPLVTGMPAMHEKLNYGFIVHFLKDQSGDCSAENFCAISIAPAAGDKYQIVAEPLPMNLGPGPVKLVSVVPFNAPHWLVMLEGLTVENAGTGYCSTGAAASGGGVNVTKRRASLLALVQGRFRTTFNGYIGEDLDDEKEGTRKNEYVTTVALQGTAGDPAAFYYYVQERKWYTRKRDPEKDVTTVVTKEEIECKLLNAEGALGFLPRDRQALLEAKDAKFKNCNVAGKYVQQSAQ